MKTISCIIKKVDRFDYKIVFVYENGSRNELPAVMSLHTAREVQKLFRKTVS